MISSCLVGCDVFINVHVKLQFRNPHISSVIIVQDLLYACALQIILTLTSRDLKFWISSTLIYQSNCLFSLLRHKPLEK